MLLKLKYIGINGEMFNIIKSLYYNNTCAVMLKEFVTPWFNASIGIRQGDSLSPTMFSIYINDLATVLKERHKGVKFGDQNCCVLLYADNIALLSETSEELQAMIDTVHDWCMKWRLKVNSRKWCTSDCSLLEKKKQRMISNLGVFHPLLCHIPWCNFGWTLAILYQRSPTACCNRWTGFGKDVRCS